MASNYFLRAKADKDLEDIYLYSVNNFGQLRAEQYIDDLVEAFESLARQQNLGRKRRDINPALYSYQCVSHIIYYKQLKTGIDILRILHQSMDVQKHL